MMKTRNCSRRTAFLLAWTVATLLLTPEAYAQSCPRAEIVDNGRAKAVRFSFATSLGSEFSVRVEDEGGEARSFDIHVTEPSTGDSVNTLPLVLTKNTYFQGAWKRGIWDAKSAQVEREDTAFALGIYSIPSPFETLKIVTIFIPSAEDESLGVGASFEYYFSENGELAGVESHCGNGTLEELLPPDEYLSGLVPSQGRPEILATTGEGSGVLYESGHLTCRTPDNRVSIVNLGKERCLETSSDSGTVDTATDLDTSSLQTALENIKALLFIAKRPLPRRTNLKKFGEKRKRKILRRRRAIIRARLKVNEHLESVVNALSQETASQSESLQISQKDVAELVAFHTKASRPSLGNQRRKRRAWANFRKILHEMLEKVRGDSPTP